MLANFKSISMNSAIVDDVAKLRREGDQEDEPLTKGLLSLPRFDLIQSQFVRTEGQTGSFSHYLQCGDTEGDKLVVGTEMGMAMLRVNPAPLEARVSKASEKKIEHQWMVLEKKLFLKLSVIDELSMTIAILGLAALHEFSKTKDSHPPFLCEFLAGKNSRLGAFRFTNAGSKYEKFPNTKGCHDFSYCWKDGKLQVVAAVKTSLLLFTLTKYDDTGAFTFTLKKEYYTPAPCNVLRFYPNNFLLGFRELSEFHTLEVDSSHIDQLCGSQAERAPKDVLYLESCDEYFACFAGQSPLRFRKSYVALHPTLIVT